MELIESAGHYGRTVWLDLCRPCASVWFDEQESLRLGARGWLALLRRLRGATQPEPSPSAARRPLCPRCARPLEGSHNRTRFGRYRTLACSGCGGHLQSQVLLLAQQGLLRPLLRAEHQALTKEGRPLCCRSCGAPLEPSNENCGHCATPALVLDPLRLAQALTRFEPRTRAFEGITAGRAASWPCRGCGRPLDPTHEAACGGCGHPVVLTDGDQLGPVLDAIEAELDVASRRPVAPPPLPYPKLPSEVSVARGAFYEALAGTAPFGIQAVYRAAAYLGALALVVLLARCI